MTRNFSAPDGSTHKIEILADGEQIVVAGIHPEIKRDYSWHGGEPWTTPREQLPYVREAELRAFLDEATRMLVEEFGFSDKGGTKQRAKANGAANGGEHYTRSDWGELIGNILAGESLHDSITAMAASFVATGMSDDAAIERLQSLMAASAAPKDARGRDRYDEIPRAVRSARAKFEPQTTAGPVFDPWQQYIVPDFPLRVLPQAVQNYVTSQAVVIGCDPSAMAMAALTAFSGALDHRFAVKMMRTGNWWEHPRLWTLLVGDPSRKKTPIINEVTVPLERHQNDLRRSYEARLRDYEAAKKRDKDTDVEKPDPPVRYVVWDSTTEKLGEILSRSEHGLLVKRDEFSGWIGGMEKYSSGSRSAGADRGFWLQAYDGGPHAVDRIARGETYIGNLSVSLIGGIQPAKLRELHGLTSDGLLQRFLPVMMRAPALPRDCESDAQDGYHSLVYKLIRAKHERLFLSDRALVMMNDLRAHLHQLEQAAAGLADGFQAFVGKLAGVTGRLAVILHMAENPEKTPREIAAATVANVHTLIVDFIIPHAFEFYRAADSEGERLRRLASWILTSNKTRIVVSDLTTNIADFRGLTLMQVSERVSPLIAAGWLQPDDRSPLCRVWVVSPQVHVQLAERAKQEEARKALLRSLMGSPHKATI